jgi:hypothetical protein
MELVLFILSIVIIICGGTFLIVKIYKRKDFVIGVIFILIILSVSNLSFGFGCKYVHVLYEKAYYQPTLQLFSYLANLIRMDKSAQVKEKINFIDQQLKQIPWRDTSSYNKLVENMVKP